MLFLAKLIWRDFLRNRTSFLFTFLAIATVSCLIVWYVASIDTAAFARDNGMAAYFGKYTLALHAQNGFDDNDLFAFSSIPGVADVSYASQQDTEMLLLGFDGALIPSGMGARLSPSLIGLTDKQPPFELAEGRWFANDGECVTGTAAEKLLTAVAGQQKSPREIHLGDKIQVKGAAGTRTLTVVGRITQKIPNRFTLQNGQTFAFGFGAGIGGRPMGGGQRPNNARSRGQRPDFRLRPIGATAPAVYVSLSDSEAITGHCDTNLLYVQLSKRNAETKYLRACEAHLGAPLANFGITETDTQPQKLQSTQGNPDKSVVAQVWSTIGIVILASIFIIFTTLSMGFSEKTRQLSLLRTLGFTRGQVATLILLQGLSLGVLGWLGGLASGLLLLTVLVRFKTGFFPLVTIGVVPCLFALASALVGAFLASLLPAWRATRISPVETMTRRATRFPVRKCTIAAIVGLLFLSVLRGILLLPNTSSTLVLRLFSTVGTISLVVGLLLVSPAIVALSERLFAPLLARLFGLHPKFLRSALTTSWRRTLCTMIALSLGLWLYTAIHIWAGSMLKMFLVPREIPDVLVRLHPAAATPEAIAEVKQFPRIVPERTMRTCVAQPELHPELAKRLQSKGAWANNLVVMGIDAATAWRKQDPLISLRFLQGSRSKAFQAFSQPGARVCVIPETLAQNGGLRVGDVLRLRKGIGKTTQEYVDYTIAGVVEFPWIWFSKCSGVRVSAGRTAALIFVPYETPIADFAALDNAFLWFDTLPKTTFSEIEEYMTKVATRHSKRNPLLRMLRSFSGGTLWDSGLNKNYVQVSSNESLNNSLTFRAISVIRTMTRMPLVILTFSILAILNTMVVSVKSRRWELGVMRACGVTRFGILRLILAEALLIGFAACTLSFAAGLFYAWCAISLVDFAPLFGVIAPPLHIPWHDLASGYLLAIALSAIAGIYPAFQTASTEPSVLLARKEQ
ncbi:MAG: FtsX-like permease family protein [Victivallales bacterium]|nr:FtsX-like permease family protein [Victivallales bacterium]